MFKVEALISASFLKEAENFGVMRAYVLVKHPEGFVIHWG